MTKVFFRQYQYVQYFMILFAFLFWVPYWVYVWIDGDLVELNGILKSLPQRPKLPHIHTGEHVPPELAEKEGDIAAKADDWLKRMFSIEDTKYKFQLEKASRRIFGDFFCDEDRYRESYFELIFHRCREYTKIVYRLLYALLYLLPIFVINRVYDGYFLFLGFNWVDEYASIYLMDAAHTQYPYHANVFLPAVAFCDISIITGGRGEELHVSKLICEVYKHSSMQYVFFLLWIAIFIGFIVSPLDLLMNVTEFIRISQTKLSEEFKKYENIEFCDLTIRERRYLITIWKMMSHDDILLKDVIEKIVAKKTKTMMIANSNV